MRHPSEGVLRRLVDEPAGVTDDERTHIAGCPTCLRALDTARADAQLVGAALATPVRRIDTDAAWARLSTTTTAPVRQASVARGGWRTAVRRPAVAASATCSVSGSCATSRSP